MTGPQTAYPAGDTSVERSMRMMFDSIRDDGFLWRVAVLIVDKTLLSKLLNLGADTIDELRAQIRALDAACKELEPAAKLTIENGRFRAALERIINEGDYTAPEGMKRIAISALAGTGDRCVKCGIPLPPVDMWSGPACEVCSDSLGGAAS